jgi:hypothetical protein
LASLFVHLKPILPPLLVFVVVLAAIALFFAFLGATSGRRLVRFVDGLLRDWACLLPLIAFGSVIVVEYAFDVRFLKEPSEFHKPPDFHWANPATDGATALRVASALYVVELFDAALAAAALVTIVYCLREIYRLWCRTHVTQRVALFVAVAIVAEVHYALWFTWNPIANVVSSTLGERADALMGLNDPMTALMLATLTALWLIAMTSGFIVATAATAARAVQEELDQLTVLLYLAAAVVVLFMFALGADTFSVAALLAQGKESTGRLVQELALVQSLNFGVFWSLFLAAMHYPSVWAILRKPRSAGLEDKDSPSPTRYYRTVAATLSVFAPLIIAVLTKLLDSLVN